MADAVHLNSQTFLHASLTNDTPREEKCKQIEDKVVSSRGWEAEERIDLVRDVEKWRDLGNMAINCRVLLNLSNFLTSKENSIFPRRNLLHGFSQLTRSLVKVS